MAAADPVTAAGASLPSRPRPAAPRRDVLSGSPRTPLLGRSISGAFTSPGAYARDPEEIIIYELSTRYFKAGFAGESKPRCISRFGYGVYEGRRVGDFSNLSKSAGPARTGEGRYDRYELYRNDLRDVNLGLAKDRFERVVRGIHIDYLQLDQKPRKAVLVVSSLVPTSILDLALDVLFSHYTQPPSITLLSRSVMSCVSAGLRNALVLDIGWEESVATVVGEYRVIAEQRSTRAGKMLSDKLVTVVNASLPVPSAVSFATVEEIRDRITWCRARDKPYAESQALPLSIPPLEEGETVVQVPFQALSQAVESTLCVTGEQTAGPCDDEERLLQDLAYQTLLSISSDLRGECATRIVITGRHSHIPGLRARILQELQHLIDTRRWSPVDYGSRHDKNRRPEVYRTPHAVNKTETKGGQVDSEDHKDANKRGFGKSYSKVYPPLRTADGSIVPIHDLDRAADTSQTAVRPDWRPLDAVDFRLDMVKWLKDRQVYAEPAITPVKEANASSTKDPATQKLDRTLQAKEVQPWTGKVRGVDSLGAWAGASMVASLRVQGIHEVEREDFLKHGYRESMAKMI